MAYNYCWYCVHATKKGGQHVWCDWFNDWRDKWDSCPEFAPGHHQSSFSGLLGLFLLLN